MDEMFTTFNTLSMNNFTDLTSGVIPWLEENCKPTLLWDITVKTLDKLNNVYGMTINADKK